MFSLIASPAILLTESVTASSPVTRDKEEVSVSMTVNKSANTQGKLADDVSLMQLYDQFRRPIHSYTYRLLGNWEDADDATQEVFVRACTSWDGLYEREALSAWLYRIATNLCVDLLRRRKRASWWSFAPRVRQDKSNADLFNEDMFPSLADSGGIPEIAERELIRHTLAEMPVEYAAVLVLSAAQGVPYQEIAQIIGISPHAAATRISRAKKMFMQQYQRLSKDGTGPQERKL